jgi:branched-subunit amino acid ABC-type transport system permease component
MHPLLAFARALTYDIMHIYAFKMAAVFMITTSTLVVHTRVTARWLALLGYASAAFLLIGSSYLDWVLFVFPCWILLVSVYILIDNLRRPSQAAPTHDR